MTAAAEGATVTDANLVLGRLDPDGFAGGRIPLNTTAAQQALQTAVGEALKTDAPGSAQAVIEIVDENMASAARVHAVEKGLDVTERTVIAFGGGAPLHAIAVARKLGIGRVIIPRDAGVGSAVGFLLAPIAFEVVRSRFTLLEHLESQNINALFAEMEEEAAATVRLGSAGAPISTVRHAFIRYAGQGHEIKIALPNRPLTDDDRRTIAKTFDRAYRAQYGQAFPVPLEILTWSLGIRRVSEAVRAKAQHMSGEETQVSHQRMVWMPGADHPSECSVAPREAVSAAHPVSGPAVITEDQTTLIVPKGWTLETNAYGDLVATSTPEASIETQTASVLSTIQRQVVWNRLISIVEEQAQALIRTAFSTTVREAGDLSAGIFDLYGRMLAQAVTGTPGHVNAMATSVGYFLEEIPLERMQPGDVYVTNDPWLGTGHLFDFTVVTPAFIGDRLVGLLASTVHVVDIGGRGFGPDAGQVYEEGLCVPILPLFERGEPAEAVMAIVRANVREPDQVIGDLYSLTVATRWLRPAYEMMQEFALNNLEEVGEHIISRSRRQCLKRSPPCPWEPGTTR